jgi:hypothetical protein
VPTLKRNTFGATIGGPILKDSCFSLLRTRAKGLAIWTAPYRADVPLGLTNDRSAAGIAAAANAAVSCGGPKTPPCITAANIDPIALQILTTKVAGGGFLFPSATITDPNLASAHHNPCFTQTTGIGVQGAYSCPPTQSLGIIHHTLGCPRFLQMALHLTF